MLDSKLQALAGCPVIEAGEGAMVFKPNPVITAPNNPILAHEICHVLAGKEDFEIFTTAVIAREDNKLFRHVLNMLYDWYHEFTYGKYSGYLYNKLNLLHENLKVKQTGIDILDMLYQGYLDRSDISKVLTMPHNDAVDLVVMADNMVEDIISHPNLTPIQISGLCDRNNFGSSGPKLDIDKLPKSSSYYISAVARYYHFIKDLTKLWKRNKHSWSNSCYGEIDWKNLVGMLLGEKLNLPVWRLFEKTLISRSVYLVIDRSGSTGTIQETIMDTAVIIAESLRMVNVPVSILDVGVTNSIVNSIDKPLDLSWFTPMSENGTPLGAVCSLIKGADHSSYLLIITDGCPNDWNTLKSALAAFPGSCLTFVIGDSYGSYLEEIGNAIHVEPHTIIRELIQNETLS